MRVVVLGANGRLGKQVLAALAAAGHEATPVVRSADKRFGEGCVVGDPCEPDFLEDVLPGHDAVVSTLGPRLPTRAASAVYARSGAALAQAMAETGVRRVLVTSSGLLFPPRTWIARALPSLVPAIVQGCTVMEAHLTGADLDWTIVRTDFLHDAEDESCRVGIEEMPEGGGAVSRAAVARVLVERLARPGGERLGVCGVA